MGAVNTICTIGIAGFSGSGKTTLIRKILPELKKQGLTVGILKHIHHKLNIDTSGKDTDLFYRAGADFVFAHDASQAFARYNGTYDKISDLLKGFPAALDLIIVEGHKDIALNGIWLSSEQEGATSMRKRKIISRNNPAYLHEALTHIMNEIEKFHSERSVMAGLLIGGKSTRMGTPKALLKVKGRSLAGRSFNVLSSVSEKTVLLGAGQIPKSLHSAERLSDVPRISGPMAGMLSAFRWSPDSTWIISSVDMPLMHKEAWQWLLGLRKPGVWAILPKIGGSKIVETAGAVYEPMIFDHIEALAGNGTVRLQEIARHPKVITPLVPESLVRAWRNVNTPAEWKDIREAEYG